MGAKAVMHIIALRQSINGCARREKNVKNI